jgi:hypothetical protein
MLSMLFLVHMISLLLLLGLRYSKRKISLTLQRHISGLFHFSIYIRLTLLSSLHILTNAFLEIRHPSSITSLIISLFLILPSIVLPMIQIIHYHTFPKTFTKGRLAYFYSDLKSSPLAPYFHTYYILRRAALALLIIIFHSYSFYAKMAIFTLVQIIPFVTSIIFRMYIYRRDNILEIISEFSFVSLLTLLIISNELTSI